MSVIVTDALIEVIASACWLYLAIRSALEAVCSATGGPAGFAAVVWLTEQPHNSAAPSAAETNRSKPGSPCLRRVGNTNLKIYQPPLLASTDVRRLRNRISRDISSESNAV